jgi:hypothetical protein
MKYSLFIIYISFFACQNKSSDSTNAIKNMNKKNDLAICDSFDVDTIIFDHIESSYLGSAQIYKNSIYFVDKKFCWIFEFNPNGKILNRYLGRGNGPKEIPTGEIDGFKLFCDDKFHIFWDPSLRFMVFNKDFEIILNSTFDRGIKYTKEERLKNPKPEMHGIYSLTHGRNLTRYYDDHIYTTIYSEYPGFNPLVKTYYKTAKILVQISPKNGSYVNIIGSYSPEYLKYKYIPQFANICYDISDEGIFFLGYEADSLIYKYDKNFNIEQSFGVKGNMPDTKYLEVKDINSFFEVYEHERKTKSYYNWIEYVDELNILFRSYTNGNSEIYDGLQLYRDSELLMDVSIPKGMKVLGYIHPYVYSHPIIDELNEEIKVFRFKVDYSNESKK